MKYANLQNIGKGVGLIKWIEWAVMGKEKIRRLDMAPKGFESLL